MKPTKKVYLLRHGEKDSAGMLTPKGRQDALKLRELGVTFKEVYSSDSERTIETAKQITGRNPVIDAKAGFYMASSEKSNEINNLAKRKNISFLEAVYLFDDVEVLQGLESQARQLNSLVDQILGNLSEGEKALIVSHDLTISPAMKLKGIPLESLDYLGGYVIEGNGDVSALKS